MTGPRIKDAPIADANWYHRAICFPDHALFDSTHQDDITEAKRVCNTLCAVKAECLEDALTHESQPGAARHGVRGGLTEDERAKLPRRPREPAPIKHGTKKGFDAHERRGEKPCDPCRLAKNAHARDKYAKRKDSA